MKRILSVILLFFVGLKIAVASNDEIVAIVEENTITLSELKEMTKIMGFFTNQTYSNEAEKKAFQKMVLESMINDQIMMDFAQNNFIKASDEEVKYFIASIEASGNFAKGNLANHIQKNLGVSKEAFMKKMRMETTRAKIVREHLGQKLNLGEKDVENLALNTNLKDANLDLQILTAINNRDKTYRRLEGIRYKIKNCDSLKKIRYEHIANLEEKTTKLSQLSPALQNVVKNLPIGQPSDVITEEAFRVVIVCKRSIEEFSDNDKVNMLNFIGGKKVATDSQKFFQDLRKKAYVKILF